MKVFFALIVFLLLFTSVCSAEEIIRSIEIQNSQVEKHPDMRAVMRLKVGDPFDVNTLEHAINDLRKWGVFQNVDVLVEHRASGAYLTFQLEDAFLIKDIQIQGNYPLLEKKVKRAIFLAPGDVYEPSRKPEQVDRLLAFYEKEGYRNTVVLIQEEKDFFRHTIVLKIRLEKGRGYRIDDVGVQGNTVFSNTRLTNKISRFFDYSPNRVKKGVEAVQKLYRNHDYPRARVRVTNLDFNDIQHTVRFTLDIREGKKVEVDFSGNHHQQTRHLKEGLGILENGDVDDFELEHSKNQILFYYQQRGYEEVRVEVEKKQISRQHAVVHFHIQEGPKRVIQSIDIAGNAHFSDKTLKTHMQTQSYGFGSRGILSEPVLKQDFQTIESYYEQNGFLSARMGEWKKSLNKTLDKYQLNLSVEEGKQTRVQAVTFSGLEEISAKKLEEVVSLHENSSYSTVKLEEDVQALLIYMAEKGYPYAEIKTVPEFTGEDRVILHYEIREGVPVRIGKILFVGNHKTKTSALRKALRFKEGERFSPKKILLSQVRMRKLGIFDGLTLETLGLKEKEEVVHVVVRVEEKKSQIVDFGLSYDTDTSFKAKVSVSRLNLMGWGKHLDAKFTVGLQLNRAEMAYNDPELFGSDWQFSTHLFGQWEHRPFFEDFQTGAAAALSRDITRRLSMLLKYDITRTDFVEEKTTFSELKPGTADNTTGKLQYSVVYDRRDNFGDPHSGIYLGGQVAFGTQFQGNISNFLKFGENLGYWWSPFRSLTVANALRFDGSIALNHRPVPAQELFFLGGDDTVRGFKEDAINPSGGHWSLVHNFELQLRLLKGIQLVGFLDSGAAVSSFRDFGQDSLRHSAGVGLHYVTPVGPIRLDYGWVLDRKTGESPGRLHFTFGYFF